MQIAYHKQKILLKKISELETIALLRSLFLYSLFYKHVLTSKESGLPVPIVHKIKQSYELMMNKAYEMGQDLHIQRQFWKWRAKCSIQNWKHHLSRFQSRSNKFIFLDRNSCTTYQSMQTVKKKGTFFQYVVWFESEIPIWIHVYVCSVPSWMLMFMEGLESWRYAAKLAIISSFFWFYLCFCFTKMCVR